MSAPTETHLDLLRAANIGHLTVSGVRYYVDGVEVDTAAKWAAIDMLAGDPLLFIPDVAQPAKHKLVRPTVRGLAVLDGTEVPS
jgi:hypothetical protein